MPLGQWLDNTWGSLFGSSSPGAVGSSVYGPPSSAAPSQLGGLLDPRGIREQAFYQGLGGLSQGLLAAGLPHPATQGSLIPGALAAFQPAYNAGIQSGGQMAALDQQARDQRLLEQYRATHPELANMPSAVLAQVIPRMAGNRPATAAEAQATLGPNYDPNVSYQYRDFQLEPIRTPSLARAEAGATARGRVENEGISTQGVGTIFAPGTPAAQLFGITTGGGAPSVTGQSQTLPPQQAPQQPPAGPIQTAQAQLRQSESGGNPNAVGPEVGGPGTGTPRAQGVYQFMPATWAGVAQAHPELQLTPEGIRDPAQQDRAFRAHATDILQQTQDLVGRQVNGVTVTPEGLIRGAFMGGIQGVRRYVESGGRDNPRDINGLSVGDYVASPTPSRQRGGGGGGGSAAPAAPAAYGGTVSMSPGAMPPPTGTTTVQPSQPGQAQAMPPEVAAGQQFLTGGQQAPTAVPAGPTGKQPGLPITQMPVQSPFPQVTVNPAPTIQPFGTGGATLVGPPNPAEVQRVQRLTEQAIKTAEDTYAPVVRASAGLLQSVNSMRQTVLADPNMRMGPAGGVLNIAATWARSLGATDLANRIQSPGFSAASGEASAMLLSAIGGSLGPGISNSDRAEIARQVPNPLQDRESFERFLTAIEQRAQRNLVQSHRGYATAMPNYSPASDPLTQTTAAQLQNIGVDPGILMKDPSRGVPRPAAPAATTQPPPPPPAVVPPLPPMLPSGSQWSASRQQWRDPAGNIYDRGGTLVERAGQ